MLSSDTNLRSNSCLHHVNDASIKNAIESVLHHLLNESLCFGNPSQGFEDGVNPAEEVEAISNEGARTLKEMGVHQLRVTHQFCCCCPVTSVARGAILMSETNVPLGEGTGGDP